MKNILRGMDVPVFIISAGFLILFIVVGFLNMELITNLVNVQLNFQ